MKCTKVKCSGCNIVINEVLTFVNNKLDVMDNESLLRICISSFTALEIETAKSLLFECIKMREKNISRRGEGKTHRDMEDILTTFKDMDPELLPIFVAKDLNRLPPVTFDHVDVTALLKTITLLKSDVSNILENYATRKELSDLETKWHDGRYASILSGQLRVNMKRGAACTLDSGPMALQTPGNESPANDSYTLERLDAHAQVNGSWGLPAFVCDIYIAMDVTSSTSSIFNLVAISVDRYIAVTQPIKYAKHKNNRRVWFTIVLVWLISAAIGTPVVLGLNDTPDRNYEECLFNSQNYVIYSSLGSFYIPCIMMMFLYYSIFKALRIRAKKQRAAKKPPVPEGSQAVVIENVAQTRRLAETALDAATNTGSGSNEDDHDDSFEKRSVELEADADECHVIPNDKSTEFMLATVAEEAPKTPKLSLKSPPCVPDPNGNNDSGYAPSHVEEATHATPPGSPAPHAAWRKNGNTAKLDADSRNASLALRSEDDQDATSQFGDCKKERKASAATARFTIYKANKASKKKREKSSAKKERKATKTLAIVLGVFLFCWAPFFTCSVLDAVCGKLGLPYSPGVTVFILTTWLGYINSFLNPVIYTIFNPEFRKAFRKILHCGT